MIIASNLSKSVQSPEGTLNILSDINLSIMESESLAIVGPSGSGKSTLLGILAGLDTPTSGDVVINNKNIVSMSEEERAKYRSKYVGFVFQSFHLLPGLTAIENVSLPLEIKDVPNTASLASDYLEMVGLKIGHVIILSNSRVVSNSELQLQELLHANQKFYLQMNRLVI